MLTLVRRTAVAMAAAMCAAITLTATPAAAERICVEESFVNGQLQCTKYAETGSPGTDTGSGGSTDPATPTCDIASYGQIAGYADKNPSAPYCSGQNICFTVDHYTPLEMPTGPKPQEDSVARVTLCGPVIGPPVPVRIFWSGDEEPPTLAEQAQTATDNLEFTTPTVSLSPETRTLVNLDTWFWLPDAQQRVTASAFTLVATAQLRSMTVDPGDGSGRFTCAPVPATAAEAAASCIHQYRKASTRGSETVDGRPAYRASVTTIYDLTFTNGGNAIEIPGAPATINGAPSTAAVRVDEVQSVVRPNR